MEDRDDAFLRCGVEINQKLAAGNEIELRKRRVTEKILFCEDDGLPKFGCNPVSMVFLDEKPLQPRRRDVGLDRVGVAAVARGFQRLFVNIGREYLELEVLSEC